MAAWRSRWVRVAAAGAVSIAAAAAWIPVRDRLSNTDLALVLVLLIAAAGWLAGPAAALGSALCAAVTFDLADTRPYGTLAISRTADLTTALILLVTGVLVGAGAARLAKYRNTENRRIDALAVVMEASGLVATGEAEQLVKEAIAAELIDALNLADCRFHPEPPTGIRPAVSRDGSLVGLIPGGPAREAGEIDLPVWHQGDIVAHYRLVLGEHRPGRGELRVALSLADQAGAAIAAIQPDPPPTGRGRRLRIVHHNPTGGAGPESAPDEAQPEAPKPTPGQASKAGRGAAV